MNTVVLPASYVYPSAQSDPFSPSVMSSSPGYGLGGFDNWMGMTGYIDPFGPDTPANLHAFNLLVNAFTSAVKRIRDAHQTQMKQLPSLIDKEVKALASSSPAYGASLLQKLTAKVAAVHQLYGVKSAELIVSEARANKGFGKDEVKNTNEYLRRMEDYNRRDGKPSPYFAWHDSVVDYYKVRLLWEAKNILINKLRGLENNLQVEQARVKLEQQQAYAQQQLLAAQLAAQQLALVRAQAAEEQQRLAQEQDAQRLAEEKTTEKPNIEVEAPEGDQGKPIATLKVHGAFGPAALGRPGMANALVNSARLSAIATRALASLRGAVESFLQSSRQFGAETASQVAKVFSSLLLPSALDNSDFFASSVPAADVLPHDETDLHAIAAAEGEVAIPGWGGLLADSDLSSLTLVEPTFIDASAPVQVRVATYDAQANAYNVMLPNNASITLTWTPIAFPGSNSTSFPEQRPIEVPYIGATLAPIEIEADAPSVAPPNLHGLITLFPVDSGLEPIFTVYSSPYEDATTTGEHSGRNYNPEKAGGPIQDLSWQGTTITQAGIDLVKLHTGRLDHSAANDVMIDRLEKILVGELVITDTDKRYYTHEIRELERYREIGVDDGPVAEHIKEVVWNNAHTATLEDYKLESSEALLYSPEALVERDKQDEEYYNNVLKGIFE